MQSNVIWFNNSMDYIPNSMEYYMIKKIMNSARKQSVLLSFFSIPIFGG